MYSSLIIFPGMKPEIMIINLTTAAGVTFLLIVTVTVVIICTTCIIWRKKCEAPLTNCYNGLLICL